MRYRLSEPSVYRKIGNEVLVFQSNSEKLFRFSPETEPFFNFFIDNHSIEDLAITKFEEKAHLNRFVADLVDHGIFDVVPGMAATAGYAKFKNYESLKLLKVEEKKMKDIVKMIVSA